MHVYISLLAEKSSSFFYFYIQTAFYMYGLYIRREYLTIHYFCYAVFAIWKAFYEMKLLFFLLRHGRDVKKK